MPEISRFYGIIIAIFHNEHSPPHFHAKYGDYHAVIKIKDFALVKGYLPPKALGLVMEWYSPERIINRLGISDAEKAIVTNRSIKLRISFNVL